MDGVLLRQAERNAVLPQVVAHRDLAAERIAPPLHRELIEIVRVGLHQHRNVQPGELQGIRHALFVAEIRQADDHAGDPVAIGAEQVGAALGVRPGLHRTEFGGLLIQQDGIDFQLGE